MDLPPQGSSGQSATAPAETDAGRAAQLFEQSVSIMARLRAPGGCPWDREQSFDTIKKFTLEETYEVFDAIERRDWPHLAEELGDLMLQVLFYAEMAANEGHFTVADVLDHLNRKLIRRHPHVFGEEASRAAGNVAQVDARVEGSAAAVLRNWEEIKIAEKQAEKASHGAGSPASRLDEVPRSLPAMLEAAKLGATAQKAGFDWPDWRDLLPKLDEEMREIEAEMAISGGKNSILVESELGDLLFTAVNLSRHLGVNPEMALRGCNLRFRQRFNEMERKSELPLEQLAPNQLEQLWINAKRRLAQRAAPEPTA